MKSLWTLPQALPPIVQTHVLLAAFITLLGFGCAPKVFTKPNATAQDWARDQNDCIVKAGQAGIRGGLMYDGFIEQCLRGQGWTMGELPQED